MAKASISVDTDALDQKIAELKEATRTANETLAAVKETLREVRKVKAECEDIASRTSSRLENHLDEEAGRMLKELGEKTGAAMDAAVEKVSSEFTRLENIFLGTGDERAGASIPELIDSLPRCKRCKRKVGPNGHICERVVPDAP